MSLRTYFHGCAAVSLWMAAGCNLPANNSPLVNKPAPDIESTSLDGTKFSLQDEYADKVVLLDFWATWCGPCIAELPLLMRVARDYREKGVVLYAVNQREDPEEVRQFLEQKGWKLQVVMDPQSKFGDAYQVNGIPQLVIIGQGGIIRTVHVGYSPKIESILRKKLDEILANKG